MFNKMLHGLVSEYWPGLVPDTVWTSVYGWRKWTQEHFFQAIMSQGKYGFAEHQRGYQDRCGHRHRNTCALDHQRTNEGDYVPDDKKEQRGRDCLEGFFFYRVQDSFHIDPLKKSVGKFRVLMRDPLNRRKGQTPGCPRGIDQQD